MDPVAGAQLLDKGISGIIIGVLLGAVAYLFKENRSQAKEHKDEIGKLYELLRTKSENYSDHMMQVAGALARSKRRDTSTGLPPT